MTKVQTSCNFDSVSLWNYLILPSIVNLYIRVVLYLGYIFELVTIIYYKAVLYTKLKMYKLMESLFYHERYLFCPTDDVMSLL